MLPQWTKRSDFRIIVFYGVIATLWIVFSNSLTVVFLESNHIFEDFLSLFKEISFVIITTLGLYFVLSAELRKRTRIEQELQLERDISPVAIVLLDNNGFITYANVQAEKILRLPHSEIVGQPFNAPFLHVTDYDGNPVDTNYALMSKQLKNNETIYGIQQAIEIVKGQRILLEVNITPIFNFANILTSAIVTFNEVTNVKTQEKQLRESEASLKRAQAIAQVGDWTWNIQTNHVRLSDELYHIFNLDRSTYDGQMSEILEGVTIYPDDYQKVIEAIAAFLNTQIAGSLEFRIMWTDGSVHYVWAESGIPIYDAQGNIVSLSGIVQDITERKRTENALQESETRYRTLVEQASDAILIVDTSGHYSEANSAACKLLGYTREEILQKHMLDLFIVPEDKPLRFEELSQGKTLLRESEMIRKDGRRVSVEVSSKLLLDGSVQAIARDITERKLVEQEIRLKSAALDSAANGIVITDINGTIEWINPAFTTLTGYTADEAVNYNPRDLVRSGHQNEYFYEDMWHTILSGQVWHGELLNCRKDGSLYTEEQTITPLRNAAGEITHFIGIKQDITGRKLTEAALHKLNTELEARVIERTAQLNHIKNRIESILNSNADSIVFRGAKGSIEQVNPAFSATFGYQSDEIVFQPLNTLVAPKDIPNLEEALASVISSRTARQIDVTAACKDGSTFEAAMILSPVIESKDQMVGIVLSIHDVTNRNRMLRQAMELSQIKSRYVSMAAHDLRNPMAVILTSAEAIEYYGDRIDAAKKQIKFNQIKTSIKVMVDILDDILVMGQVESGKVAFRPAPLDLIDFCQMLIAEMEQTTKSNIHINFLTDGVADSLPMDANLLRHILGNLLSNAIKYSPNDSTVTFTACAMHDEVVFKIQDQGIGIPREEQTRLFETFHRASNARHIKGTGLGLAIVKQSTELHGGSITFESEEGRGTTFTVTLPLLAIAA